MSKDRIPVVVVESHQHVLEHIHYILRRKLSNRAKLQDQIRNISMHDGHKMTDNTNNHDNDDNKHFNIKDKKWEWALIHFDSHPDLACPNHNIPAAACYTPRKEWKCKSFSSSDGHNFFNQDEDHNYDDIEEMKNLYEMLDTSRGGIAEWITPLVLAGNLTNVHWIKNSFCTQFQSGVYNYCIGAWCAKCKQNTEHEGSNQIDGSLSHQDQIRQYTSQYSNFFDLPEQATVKTSLCHPYYLDDDSVVPEEELLLKQHLLLTVSELKASDSDFKSFQNTKSSTVLPNNTEWILDICLDYFICLNPFITEIEAIDSHFSTAIVDVMTQPDFRYLQSKKDNYNMNDDYNSKYFDEIEGKKYLHDLRDFTKLVEKFFQNISGKEFTGTYMSQFININALGLFDEKECDELLSFYTPKERGIELWNRMLQSLFDIYHNQTPEKFLKITHLVLNALPCFTLPHDSDLPAVVNDSNSSNPSTSQCYLNDLIHHRVSNAIETLKSNIWSNNPPFMITIARSADDGFIPIDEVEKVQKLVLKSIHEVYCDCSKNENLDNPSMTSQPCTDSSNLDRCKLCLLYDYGELEGSSFENYRFQSFEEHLK